MLLPAFFVFGGGAGYKRKRRRRGFRKRRFRYKRFRNWQVRRRMYRDVFRSRYGNYRTSRRPSRRRVYRQWRRYGIPRNY